MSAIDCIDHVQIGYLNDHIGIYRPTSQNSLSEVTGEDKEANIIISPFTTLFGGGSGEHPAMHIINDAAVLQFLAKGYLIDSDKIATDLEEYQDEGVKTFFQALNNVFDDFYLEDELLNKFWWKFDKNHWDFTTFLKLNNKINQMGLNKYVNSENKIVETHFEQVLMDIFGAIIIEKLPIDAIENNDIKNLVVLFKNNKENLTKYFSSSHYMENLLSFFSVE